MWQKWQQRSIRFRLTVWYALVLAAALGLFSVLIWVSLRHQMSAELDRDLAARAARLQSYVIHEAAEIPPVHLKDELEEFCQALPASDYLELRGTDSFEFHYPRVAPPSRDGMRTLRTQFNVGNSVYHLQIRSSLQPIDHTLDLLEVLLFSLVPVVIGIACLGGAWLSRRALRPVDEITTAARSIGIDNLSLRLQSPKTGDELQRLTDVWNTMLGRLEGAVQTLSQFAADASHELRTPLAVIRTSAELALRRARAPEAYRDSLAEIAQEAERMTQLVEDLLFLARHDARAIQMPMEPLDLGEVLHEVSVELQGVANGQAIRIREVSPLDCGAWISGNRAALRRLFLALLDNALKYSRAGSEVLVAISAAGGQVAATVEDFGIGIGPADRPHIFHRFYQADKARADGGFGLGLSLAQAIARAHDATIDVISEKECGSTFRVGFTSEFAGSRQAQTRGLPENAPL